MDHGKELPWHIGIGVIIDADGINIGCFATEELFGGSNITDRSQQFIEMISAIGMFQPLILQREAFDDVFTQPLLCPYAELGASVGLYPVTHENDDIKL